MIAHPPFNLRMEEPPFQMLVLEEERGRCGQEQQRPLQGEMTYEDD